MRTQRPIGVYKNRRFSWRTGAPTVETTAGWHVICRGCEWGNSFVPYFSQEMAITDGLRHLSVAHSAGEWAPVIRD